MFRLLATAVCLVTVCPLPCLALTTFGPARPISPTAFFDERDCVTFGQCNPALDTGVAVAADDAGHVVAVWVSGNHPSGIAEDRYDDALLVVRSEDGGRTWTPPTYVSDAPIEVAYAYDHPKLVTDRRR